MRSQSQALVNLISKDASLLFYLSVTSYLTVQTSHYGVIIDFRVDSMPSFLSHSKKCNVMMTLIKAHAVR